MSETLSLSSSQFHDWIKQIIGRGTRTYEGKFFFTIYDFEGASDHYSDPEWDGPPLEREGGVEALPHQHQHLKLMVVTAVKARKKTKLIKIKLSDGHERNITYTDKVLYNAHDKPVTLEEFIETLFDESIPDLFENEAKLQQIWSLPQTRAELLSKLQEVGMDKDSCNQCKHS